jgi:predicted AlkP superfamily phosphohydrolase/phosphomutase
LDYHGLSSVIVNVPVTHPPNEFNGALIPGYLAPTDPTGHPDGIIDEIRNELGQYRIYAEGGSSDMLRKFEEYVELTTLRGKAFRYLIDRFDPEFGFVQFQKTDAVFHEFPGDKEKITRIYNAVDEQIGKILQQTDPDLTLVVSDHGIGPYHGYNFHVNENLRDGGYLQSETGGRGVPSWAQMKEEKLEEGSDSPLRSALRKTARFAGNLGFTHQRGKYILNKLGIADFVREQLPVGVVYAATESVAYEESIAYYRSPSELGVRLNVKGREPSGLVEPDEYDSVRSEIIDHLSEVRTPENEPVFDTVAPREDFYSGEYIETAPDIVLIPFDYKNSFSGLLGERFSTPEEYNHKPTGILIAGGDQVNNNSNFDVPHIFDVAPTVLSSFSLPPSKDMDGTTIPIVDSVEPEDYPEYNKHKPSQTRNEDVEKRLSDLGYLE